VHPRLQTYSCFFCGVEENVVRLIMELHNLTFWQALAQLRKKTP